MEKSGIYIHIPFCRQKCPYCDFYSISEGKDEVMDLYTNAICRDIEDFSNNNKISADTVYFGGGTPTVLGAKRLDKILNKVISSFSIASDSEITIEANPVTADTVLFTGLKASGFNRISLGVQSTNDEELKILGRLHNSFEAFEAFNIARRSGFDNISLDLMLAISKQTQSSLYKSLNDVIFLSPEHISTYLLKIEENTPYNKIKDSLDLPDDDLAADYYLLVGRELLKSGYKHYEISNYSKPGYESRHNSKYWTLTDYVGFGPAAHSCFHNNRSYYSRDIDGYIKGTLKRIPDGEVEHPKEDIMLGLRMSKGIDIDALKKKYNCGEKVNKTIIELTRNRLAVYSNGILSLTEDGFLVSNSIILKLLSCFE